MSSMTTTRMLLSTAALAAVAALFAGGANAVVQDDGGGASYNQPIVGGDFVHAALANRAAATTVQLGTIPYLSHGIGVDESQFATPTSPGFTGDSARKVDQAFAAANEAYDTYRDKTAIAAEANARIPADTSSVFAAQESLRLGRYLPKAGVEIRLNGQLAGTQSRAGSTRYGYVVGGELIAA